MIKSRARAFSQRDVLAIASAAVMPKVSLWLVPHLAGERASKRAWGADALPPAWVARPAEASLPLD